jgi:hypothetical protein
VRLSHDIVTGQPGGLGVMAIGQWRMAVTTKLPRINIRLTDCFESSSDHLQRFEERKENKLIAGFMPLGILRVTDNTTNNASLRGPETRIGRDLVLPWMALPAPQGGRTW